MVECKKCGADRPLMRSGWCSACMRAIPRVQKPKRAPGVKKITRTGPGGLDFGSKRLATTLDALCGDDLPDSGDDLTAETSALLVVAAAIILYFLFFHGRGGKASNQGGTVAVPG